MPSCFVIMPITTPDQLITSYGGDRDHFDHVLQHLFRPAIERLAYELIPPAVSGADVIHAEVIRRLETADLVLCDLSTLNANVFFELGIRTSLDRPVCLVKDRLTQIVPFDTTVVNHWTYDHTLAPWTLENEIIGLHTHMNRSINTSAGQNSMWRLFGLTMRATNPAPTDTESAKLDAILQLLQNLRDSAPSSGTPMPTVAGVEEPRTGIFLRQAQDIAGRVNAVFTVSAINEDHNKIVLDLGGMLLGEKLVKQVLALGAECGFDVEIEGNGYDQLRKKVGDAAT